MEKNKTNFSKYCRNDFLWPILKPVLKILGRTFIVLTLQAYFIESIWNGVIPAVTNNALTSIDFSQALLLKVLVSLLLNGCNISTTLNIPNDFYKKLEIILKNNQEQPHETEE